MTERLMLLPIRSLAFLTAVVNKHTTVTALQLFVVSHREAVVAYREFVRAEEFMLDCGDVRDACAWVR